MKSSTVSTGVAATGIAGSIVVILVWIASIWRLIVPPEVATAATVIVGCLLHLVAAQFGITLPLNAAPPLKVAHDPEPAPPSPVLIIP